MMMTHKRYGYNCVESIWFDARGCVKKKDGLGFNNKARVGWPCLLSQTGYTFFHFKENEDFASSTKEWELSVVRVKRGNRRSSRTRGELCDFRPGERNFENLNR